MTPKEAKILKAFDDLATGFANLAKDMRGNDNIYDENYLHLVLMLVGELRADMNRAAVLMKGDKL